MKGAIPLDFDKATSKGLKLIRSKENKNFGLLIIVSINLGLRIQDLLGLTFKQLQNDSITIIEGKTKKKRTLKINHSIKEVLNHFKDDLSYELGGHCFRSQKGTVYSSQHVNRLIKKYFKGKVSSHSFRKTFGRRVWENDGESERALIMLSQIFNHSSTATTRIYLGIQQEEIDDIYDIL